jgi:hypothetical protein
MTFFGLFCVKRNKYENEKMFSVKITFFTSVPSKQQCVITVMVTKRFVTPNLIPNLRNTDPYTTLAQTVTTTQALYTCIFYI